MPTIPMLPPLASPIGNGDLFALDQSATTYGATASAVLTYIENSLNLGGAAFVNVPIAPTYGGTGISDPTIYTLPVAQGTSNFAFVGPLANGELLIGSNGANPVAANLIAGGNISILNGPGTIEISAVGIGGFTWNVIANPTQLMISNNGYIINDSSSLVTLTLPTTSVVGDEISIVGQSADGWTIAQNAGQSIIFGTSTTTTGASGSLSSTHAADSFYMVCTVANTVWTIASGPVGNLTIV